MDNPDLYSVLYLSDSAEGAIAEAFGRFPEWIPAILEGPPSLPGSARALARYRLRDDMVVCDLDDAKQLVELKLRPSEIVSRDYVRTRSWARLIYARRRWPGVKWWSYYDSRWASSGLWDISGLTVESIERLHVAHPALVEASRVISRRIVESRSPKSNA